jgi:hypothetical protein
MAPATTNWRHTDGDPDNNFDAYVMAYVTASTHTGGDGLI